MIEARLLGHNECKGILNKLEAGQVGNGGSPQNRTGNHWPAQINAERNKINGV